MGFAGGEIRDSADACVSAGQQQDPQRIEGQWYTPIKLGDFTLYQNQSGLVDRISIQDEKGITYSAKTYNYLWYLSTDKTMPRKIDIYKAAGDESPKQIMEIKILNYKKP